MKRKLLSHSARQSFKRCNRLYLLEHERGLELIADSKGLRMGRNLAASIEHSDPAHCAASYEKLCSNWMLTQSQVDDLKEEQVIIEEYCRHYLKLYRSDFGNPTLEREHRFDSPVVGRGILDGIMHELDGQTVGIEDKLYSAGVVRNDFEQKLSFDDQVTAYFYAMREAGTPLDKMLYRVAIKPGIGWRRIRQPETLEAYRARLVQYIADKPELFREYTVTRSNEQLDLAAISFTTVQYQVKVARRLAKKYGDEAFPQNTDACNMFGKCRMFSFCSGEQGWENKYRVKPDTKGLTGNQQRVYAALKDSFTGHATTLDAAAQAGVDGRGVVRTLRSLEARGLVTYNEDTATWHLPEQ